MKIELTVATLEHLEAISRIAYEGFRDVSTTHGFPPDFHSAEAAAPVYELLLRREDYFGLVALVNNEPVGSNFLMMSDQVGAIGPLAVAPKMQGNGIGRLLMTAVMGHAAVRRLSQLRLLQDSYNVSSLSLYCSLGFVVRDAVALVHTVPAVQPDLSVRTLIDVDLPTVDRLSRQYYKTSRHNEVKMEREYGYQTFLKERDGRATGYLIPGLAGHGVGETVDDLMSLLEEAARTTPPVFRKFLCPMRQSELFQRALKAGWRVEKVLNYMTFGPYEYPTGVCVPSACY